MLNKLSKNDILPLLNFANFSQKRLIFSLTKAYSGGYFNLVLAIIAQI